MEGCIVHFFMLELNNKSIFFVFKKCKILYQREKISTYGYLKSIMLYVSKFGKPGVYLTLTTKRLVLLFKSHDMFIV